LAITRIDREEGVMDSRSSRHGGSNWIAGVISIGLVAAMVPACSRKQPPRRNPPVTPPVVDKTTTPPVNVSTAQPAPVKDRGEALYAQHCAACHGAKGDGQGLAAKFLFPKPRDFRAGRFRLISTSNNVPTPADLDQVLVRGMPGSAMISWAHLGPEERKLLVEQVIKLRRDGAAEVERALAKEADETLSDAELKAAVDRITKPGEVVAPPAASPPTSEAIARGAALYKAKACVSCHGEKGKGDGQQKMVDAEGLATRPRDLTLGIFKGSPAFADVYRRLWLGMPGSPMPTSQQLAPEEVADLVHFVLSLSNEAHREAVVLKRVEIQAKRASALPSALSDEAWQKTAPLRLTLTPLWWRDDADPDLRVQVVHDGQSLALRLSWNDLEPDHHALRSESFEDAVAVEFYRGPAEPFVGMGARDTAVDVWMWDADSSRGASDVEDANPRIVVDSYPLTETTVANAEFDRPGTKTSAQAKVTLPAAAVGNQIVPSGAAGVAMTLEGGGPGSLTFRLPRSQLVRSQAEWRDGRWTVMFTRALQVPAGEAGLSFATGERVSAAFAVWNGSKRDRNGQKLISIWQDLVLEK
jgi:mono/diheme cytochrome c family protein